MSQRPKFDQLSAVKQKLQPAVDRSEELGKQVDTFSGNTLSFGAASVGLSMLMGATNIGFIPSVGLGLLAAWAVKKKIQLQDSQLGDEYGRNFGTRHTLAEVVDDLESIVESYTKIHRSTPFDAEIFADRAAEPAFVYMDDTQLGALSDTAQKRVLRAQICHIVGAAVGIDQFAGIQDSLYYVAVGYYQDSASNQDLKNLRDGLLEEMQALGVSDYDLMHPTLFADYSLDQISKMEAYEKIDHADLDEDESKQSWDAENEDRDMVYEVQEYREQLRDQFGFKVVSQENYRLGKEMLESIDKAISMGQHSAKMQITSTLRRHSRPQLHM